MHSMSPEKNQKPYLNRELLKNHGIRFRERTTTAADELRPWLRPLFHSLTRIPDRFPGDLNNTFGEELKRFEDEGQDRNDADRKTWCMGPIENPNQSDGKLRTDSAVKKTRNKLAVYQQAAREMQQCRVTNENEPKWVSILSRHIFLDFPKIDGESNTYE